MISPTYIVNDGSFIFVPSDAGYTISVQLPSSIIKLRNIILEKVPADELESVRSNESWILLQNSTIAIRVLKITVQYSVEHIPLAAIASQVKEALRNVFPTLFPSAPSSSTTTEPAPPVIQIVPEDQLAPYKQQGYKLSTLRTPSGQVVLVGLKPIYLGENKAHKKGVLLWTPSNSQVGIVGSFLLFSKATKREAECLIEKNCVVGTLLREKKCRLVSYPFKFTRSGFQLSPKGLVQKIGFVSKFCSEGSLEQYIEARSTRDCERSVVEAYAEKIFIAVQSALSLADMHQNGLIHGDIKLKNYLVDRRRGSICVILNDYDLAMQKGDIFDGVYPGTYPPFDIKVQCEQALNRRSGSAPLPGEVWQEHVGDSPPMESSQTRTQIEATEAIDQWAFALVLYQIINGISPDCALMRYQSSSGQILSARNRIISSLKPKRMATVDDLIRGLLSIDPKLRPPLEYVACELHSFYQTLIADR